MTSWLAAYLSEGDTFCSNQPFTRELTLSKSDFHRHLGNSHPSIALVQDELIKTYPQATWIILASDFDRVKKRLKTFGITNTDNLHLAQTKLEELRAKVPALVLEEEALREEVQMHKTCMWVNSRWKFSSDRHRLFETLEIYGRDERVSMMLLDKVTEPVKLSQTCVDYMNEVRQLCAPDPNAFMWFESVIYAGLVWDHWTDRDALNPKLFDDVMLKLITEWPINPFLKKYGDYLVPTLVAAIDSWRESSSAGGRRDNAYSVYAQVPAAIAFVLGGNQRVKDFMPKIRSLVRQMRLDDDVRDGEGKR